MEFIMLKILSIGNSFSCDAQEYLHDLSHYCGEEIYCVNASIGGCSLARHAKHLREELCEHSLGINGKSADRLVSLQEVIAMDDYDVITLQQASHFSGAKTSYYPYIDELADYIRANSNAKIYVHETWAYEIDSAHEAFHYYDRDQELMYKKLKAAYTEAAEHIGAEKIIPSGDVIQALRRTGPFDHANGGASLCRDGFHMDLIFGRYAVAATWFRALTGKTVSGNKFLPYGFVYTDDNLKKLELIQKTVDELV